MGENQDVSERPLSHTQFPSDGRQLFVGEGDFSLALCLRRSGTLPDCAVITCFSDQLSATAAHNAQQLTHSGVRVISGVDATQLHLHPEVCSHAQYDYIVFNFPHTGGKMRIQKCRQLLVQFLLSAAPLLSHQGQVWVTLCAGQGGTPRDTVPRAWGDTWQITWQAATAGLVLSGLRTFDPDFFHGYRATGNRGREARGFHARDGVTHILRLSGQQPFTLTLLQQRIQHTASLQWTVVTPFVDEIGAHGAIAPHSFSVCDYWHWRLAAILATSVGENGELCLCDSLTSLLHTILIDRAIPSSSVDQRLSRLFYLRSHNRLFRLPRDVTATSLDHVTLTAVSSSDVTDDATLLDDVMNTCDWPACELVVLDDDCSLDSSLTCSPVKRRLICDGTSLADATAILLQLLGCTKLEDVQLLVQDSSHPNDQDTGTIRCSHTGMSVFESHRGRSKTGACAVWNTELLAVCWARLPRDDWRQAGRCDFRVLHENDECCEEEDVVNKTDDTVRNKTTQHVVVMRSLFPPIYQLDLSFWLPTATSSRAFSERRLWRVLRAVLREMLVRAHVLDRFEQSQDESEVGGRQALTVRLVYQHLEHALSWQLARQVHVHWLPQLLTSSLSVQCR